MLPYPEFKKFYQHSLVNFKINIGLAVRINGESGHKFFLQQKTVGRDIALETLLLGRLGGKKLYSLTPWLVFSTELAEVSSAIVL
jgi:hypothetical protein